MRVYFFAVGTGLLGLGLWLLAVRVRVRFRGAVADGVVVGFSSRSWDENAPPHDHPIVAFVDAQGREHRFTSVAASSARGAQGARVRVRFDAARPSRAFVDGFLHFWAAPLGALALAAGALAAALSG